MQGYRDEDDAENPFAGMWMDGDSLAPPCGAEPTILPHILSLLSPLGSDKTLLDLGCGDGRICLYATEHSGCKSIGVEIEPDVCERFRELITSSKHPDRVSCIEGDLRDVDFDVADVIHVYLLPEGLEVIEAKIIAWLLADPLRKVLCNTWGWSKAWGGETAVVKVTECNGTPLFLYTAKDVPKHAKKSGDE
jgi:SAM-dependent methyltransferase